MASVSAYGVYGIGRVYKEAQSKGEGRAVRVLIPPGRTPAEFKAVDGIEGKEPKHPLDPQTGSARMAPAVRL